MSTLKLDQWGQAQSITRCSPPALTLDQGGQYSVGHKV